MIAGLPRPNFNILSLATFCEAKCSSRNSPCPKKAANRKKQRDWPAKNTWHQNSVDSSLFLLPCGSFSVLELVIPEFFKRSSKAVLSCLSPLTATNWKDLRDEALMSHYGWDSNTCLWSILEQIENWSIYYRYIYLSIFIYLYIRLFIYMEYIL